MDTLSKDVTKGHMGPWFIRDATRPYYPGVAFDVLTMLVARGELTREAVVRGPTTGQFWMRAIRTPGVSHLLGSCYSCGGSATRAEERCRGCGASFAVPADRDTLGLVNGVPQRLSAFASDAELREGAPTVAAGSGPAANRPWSPSTATRPIAEAGSGDDPPSPRELTLSMQIEVERRKTRFLMWLVGSLLFVDLVLVILVLRVLFSR